MSATVIQAVSLVSNDLCEDVLASKMLMTGRESGERQYESTNAVWMRQTQKNGRENDDDMKQQDIF